MDDDVLSGTRLLQDATHELGINLADLVAKCSIWSNPAVYRAVCEVNPTGVWYRDKRRFKKGEKRGELIGDVKLDDNTYANYAIKCAVFGHQDACFDMAVCHVWPSTCYDERYHTCIANLVILPAPLADLTDHDDHVSACLRYRSFELFGWHPIEGNEPMRPNHYPNMEMWRQPPPVNDKVMKALNTFQKRECRQGG